MLLQILFCIEVTKANNLTRVDPMGIYVYISKTTKFSSFSFDIYIRKPSIEKD